MMLKSDFKRTIAINYYSRLIKRCRETKGDRKDDDNVIDRLGQQVIQIKLSG